MPNFVNNNTYTLVNDAFMQSTGQTGLAVLDSKSLVDAGSQVLSSQEYTDKFIASLAGRITWSILAVRPYYGMFDALIHDYARGAIQKISFGDIKAEIDQSFNLVDGQSVDMYTVNKPVASQKFFYKESPYQYHISISRGLLENAFTSDTEMSVFIRSVFLSISNTRVISLENLAKACLANMVANTVHEINILTEYNATATTPLTAAQAVKDADFLRFCVKVMRTISDNMRHPLRGPFNDGTITRFTPEAKQVMYISTDFEYALETVSSYSAYHDGYVSLSNYDTVGFWQDYSTDVAIKQSISVTTNAGDKTVTGIVGMIFDVDALGVFPRREWASTTPFNSAGGYSNTYWHGNGTYYNDMSENFVYFTIRDEASNAEAVKAVKASKM